MTTTIDKPSIATLVAKYGSSSSTAWLEFDRYKLWQPSEPIPESDFTPVQGYMEKDPYIFAWGNPLVSDTAALPHVARHFVRWCENQQKRLVWCCVDVDLEEVLGSEEFGWSTVACVHEDFVDPAQIIDLTSPEAKGREGQRAVKDLKKNLHRAEKYNVKVKEVLAHQWTEGEKVAVERGIRDWKASKSGPQIASTTGLPWLDSEHRRYWAAKKDGDVVGILVLTPVRGSCWQIKNAISFPSAPKGTSETLIYTSLQDLHAEEEEARRTGGKVPHPSHDNFHGGKILAATNSLDKVSSTNSSSSNSLTNSDQTISSGDSEDSSSSSNQTTPLTSTSEANGDDGKSNGSATPGSNTGGKSHPRTHRRREADRVLVTFGLSAAPRLEPAHNLGGWKVSALSKTYGNVVKSAKLLQRGEFRNKFISSHESMYVCYPPDGFGLDAVNALLKILRK